MIKSKSYPNFVVKCCKYRPKRGETCICNKLLRNKEKWIESFGSNKNTGVDYEINTGIYLLNNNPNIIGLLNFTQKDNEAGTSDIGIVFKNGQKYNLSITKWYKNITKCICNPSGKLYGLEKNEEFKNRNTLSYNMAILYRQKNRGEIPNKKWKRVTTCPGSKNMCEFMAEEGSKSWNNLDVKIKRKNLKKILDLDNFLKPQSDGIIYWNNTKNCIEKILSWKLKINIDDYLDTFSDGIYICHGTPENTILKTQTKYNNGIIDGMSSKIEPEDWKLKQSLNYLSSWNCVAPDLTNIFSIKEIKLKK